MFLQDFHTHTNFCDGADSPEAMIKAAIKCGMKRIGLLTHSYVPFDDGYCIAKGKEEEFINQLNLLKEKYKNDIMVFCGIEQDYFSEPSCDGFDYKIGSVHYVKIEEGYISVDNSVHIVKDTVKRYFGGDIYLYAEEYYRLVADVANKTKCDIIGHIDLITKFNERELLIDPSHPRYKAASRAAVDALIQADIPFELNTGAISRGYRTTPYPEDSLLRYIIQKGGCIIPSSDSHRADTLCWQFKKWTSYAKNMGARFYYE